MYERSPIRERAEELERATLSTWAVLASETKGRDRYEDPDRVRTAFQRDRDRILHSAAFGRLAGKTETFLPAEPGAPGRGWLTRLSQRLTASQFARTLARALHLNEDLSEAVALGQTLGAPPFGPAGNAALAELTDGGFATSEQSLRVVERLTAQGRGLNLTWEVRDGILHREAGQDASTLEGQVAALADRVSRALGGLERALRAELVRPDDLPLLVRTRLGSDQETRVATVVADVVEESNERPQVLCGAEVGEALDELERVLEGVVHGRAEARAETDRAVHCMQSVAIYLRTHPGGPLAEASDHEQALIDYLSGAIDGEIVEAFTTTFRPTGRSRQ